MKKEVPNECVEILFKSCPFCGEIPNVFQIRETRYGKNNPWGWMIECKSMGCVFYRLNSPDQSFQHLLEHWNFRK